MENRNILLICIVVIAIVLIICGSLIYFTQLKETQLTTDLTEINQGDNLTITLTDENGQPLVNKTVHITICGKTYNRTTDSVGKTQIAINLNPGEYNITVEFDGELFYKKSTITNPLKVIEKQETREWVEIIDVGYALDGPDYKGAAGYLKIVHHGDGTKTIYYSNGPVTVPESEPPLL